MTDWTKSTGSSGTMMIRDTGSAVEFWIKSGSGTYNHDMPWKYTVNGATSAWKQYDYVGDGSYKRLGSWTVTSDQTVTFYLGDTDTSGLGGPTTFSHAIDRASAPNPPSTPQVTVNSSTQVTVVFSDGANNGAGIDSRQIGYGTSSSTVQTIVSSDGSTVITGLTPDVGYYFWARTHNAKGYSGWSGRAYGRMWSVPWAPAAVQLSNITQSSVHAVFVGNYGGGTPVLEYQIGYGTNSTTPQLFLTANNGVADIAGLSPGQTYYFWARGRNAVGWGPWSTVSSATLIAGAYLKVGSTWHRAVPYVNVNGTWKIAKVWGKVAGSWRESS